jgi:gas vesicle protein
MESRTNAGTTAGAGIGGLLMGILIGAVVGGVAALLLAPQSGVQTREMIRTRAGQIGDAFRGVSQDVREVSSRASGQVR